MLFWTGVPPFFRMTSLFLKNLVRTPKQLFQLQIRKKPFADM
jgi:hypothetical protein